MSWLGLLMFGVAMLLIVVTGLPVYALLLGISSAFAVIGVGLGVFGWSLLSALPYRLVGLLESDLLQALPLFALIGALLNRLPLAGTLHEAGMRLFRRSNASAELSALCVGALLAPMNGSVGASLHTLTRSIGAALTRSGMAPARAAATICIASTLGLVIPPSLVLLLLGDAMMRAHSEALNLSHAAVRIVNTQDVMRAAWVPGALVLLLALLLGCCRGFRRSAASPSRQQLSKKQVWTALLTALSMAFLFGAVATGRIYAVEAAANGGLALVIYAACTGQIDRKLVQHVLHDTMTLTGMLFALLVAATTFSLVLRGFETDAMIARAIGAMTASPMLLLLLVLAGMVACSFVLDAFEIIFLVIPLVMPPVLMVVPDPAWVAVLTLLVLQAGFLLPPFGYGLLMSRSLMPGAASLGAIGGALLPQLLAQAVLIAGVLLFPDITRWARPLELLPAASSAASREETDRLMQEAFEAQQKSYGPKSASD